MPRFALCLRHLLIAAALTLAVVVPASAQQAPEPHERELMRLYGMSLAKQGSDPILEKKIAVERTYVRSAIDDELNALVNSLTRPGSGETLDVNRAYEKQRAIVDTLEAKRKEAEVDLELLIDEEKRLYENGGQAQSGSGVIGEEYRFTGSHNELLAKKAVLEERISAVTFFLQLQQERLRRLGTERALQQFSALITVGEYLLLFLLIVAIERFVRTKFFSRISNRNHRYRATKIFTGSVYLVVIVWILRRVYTEYPGIITSFAIVGAGIAVALQDVLKDIVGWGLIVQKRLFTLGQRITVGTVTGDVMDISLLRTTLMEVASGQETIEHSGKILHLPNSFVLREPITNYNSNSDFVEATVTVVVTHDSDWKKAQAILMEILEQETASFVEHARRQNASRTQYFYLSRELKGSRVLLDIAPMGIIFTLQFPAPIGERRIIVSRIQALILERFDQEKPAIKLAAVAPPATVPTAPRS